MHRRLVLVVVAATCLAATTACQGSDDGAGSMVPAVTTAAPVTTATATTVPVTTQVSTTEAPSTTAPDTTEPATTVPAATAPSSTTLGSPPGTETPLISDAELDRLEQALDDIDSILSTVQADMGQD